MKKLFLVLIFIPLISLGQSAYKSYYENGNIKSEGHFSSGVYNGLWKEYHENGNLMYEGEYKNGESQGVFKYYNENGQLKEEKTYKDGKEIKN